MVTPPPLFSIYYLFHSSRKAAFSRLEGRTAVMNVKDEFCFIIFFFLSYCRYDYWQINAGNLKSYSVKEYNFFVLHWVEPFWGVYLFVMRICIYCIEMYAPYTNYKGSPLFHVLTSRDKDRRPFNLPLFIL